MLCSSAQKRCLAHVLVCFFSEQQTDHLPFWTLEHQTCFSLLALATMKRMFPKKPLKCWLLSQTASGGVSEAISVGVVS